jgi:hypothetical protein
MTGLDPSPPERQDKRWVTRLAGGYLVLLYVAACAVISVFGYVRRQQIPVIRTYFPSSTPTPTSTPAPPHILVHQPPANAVVLADDFESNQNGWNAYYWYSKVEVVNGRLLLLSDRPGYYGLAVIGHGTHVVPEAKYYIQADLATDVSVSDAYGLVFGLDESTGNFYLFRVIPQTGGYTLSLHTGGKWKELVPFKSVEVKAYPGSNTLGVYYDHGKIDLYLNGTWLTMYTDSQPLNNGLFGTYVDGTGFTLIADNFFAYNDK